MRKTMLCAALAAAVALPITASAVDRHEGQWYFSPSVGIGFPDKDRDATDGTYVDITVGRMITDRWSFEVSHGYQRFRDEAPRDPLDWRRQSLFGSARYIIGEGSIHPYAGLGLGFVSNRVTNIERARPDRSYFAGPFAGLEFDISDRTAIKAQVAYMYSDLEKSNRSGFWDTTVSVGLTYYIGDRPVAPPPRQQPPPPPPPAPPPPAPPAPPARPLPVSIALTGVNFDFDKCTLRPDAVSILDEAVRVMNANEIRVEVAGHTDSVGSEAYNQRLSECRARVVADYLTGKGVSGYKISSVNGYGELRPIDTNDTAEGRARNRRTELNVQD